LLGLRAKIVTHGFRKDPFKSQHIISGAHALRTSSYYFTYDADFTKVFGLHDLLIRGNLRAPVNVTNFFGLGNNTIYNQDLRNEQYYRARYNIGNLSVFLRRHLQSWMRINYGPTFQYFRVLKDENKNTFVANEPLQGISRATLYDRKTYVGAEAKVDINSRNDPNLATRGVAIDAGVRQLFGLNNSSNNVTQLHVDLGILASFNVDPRVVYGLRFGWARNYGSFEIPQAQYLSGTENLRGYRRDRFAGRSVLFFNTEIRLKLAEFSTYLFPGSVGLLFFDDVGRVWTQFDDSHTWHNGFGGGIWLAPIRRWVVTVSLAHSPEEKILPYVNFGFRF
ncbi:MAG TPA: BamA/TamA family outer membrane protein, partial [Flavisolibacter sp.]|nr:BamA/TamA family outer membrane protein [Flavisolibacter sp.]